MEVPVVRRISTALAAAILALGGPASALDLDLTQVGIALSFDQNARPHSLTLGIIDASFETADADVRARFPNAVAPLLAYDFDDRELALSPGLQRTWLGHRVEVFFIRRQAADPR